MRPGIALGSAVGSPGCSAWTNRAGEAPAGVPYKRLRNRCMPANAPRKPYAHQGSATHLPLRHVDKINRLCLWECCALLVGSASVVGSGSGTYREPCCPCYGSNWGLKSQSASTLATITQGPEGRWYSVVFVGQRSPFVRRRRRDKFWGSTQLFALLVTAIFTIFVESVSNARE